MTDEHITNVCRNLDLRAECEFRKCLAIWRSKRNIIPLHQDTCTTNKASNQQCQPIHSENENKSDIVSFLDTILGYKIIYSYWLIL